MESLHLDSATEESSKISTADKATLPVITDERNITAIVDSLGKVKLNKIESSGLVDTCAAMVSLVDSLSDLPKHPPSIYVDLEGVNLSRDGTISILQLFVLPTNQIYLIDIHTLGEAAFVTCATSGQTLKAILESDAIPKAFFDVRNDSDALYSHFGIDLAGVCDIQLMELATRSYSKRYISGLAKCLERDLSMTNSERQAWMTIKETGRKLFDPKCGGTYEVLNHRPLSEEIRQYCMQDVQFLPRLWQHYFSKMTPRWAKKVEDGAKDRVKLSQTATFVGQGRHKALGPWN